MPASIRRALVLTLLAGVPAAAGAGDAARRAILPPELPWHGKSEALQAPPGDPWATPSERDGLRTTPRYDETIAWLRKLVAQAPELKLVSLGKSPEGRDIWMVVASRAKAATPAALKATGKPTVLAQAGIHAGEIDGKDAGLMLLRDMTVRGTRRELLEGANLLFVPIFNVDGHERFDAATRINQRGPEQAGWRSTSRNLNLNRDYAKLDAPETWAMVAALDAWDPDLYLDLHVTDGMDYQYDVTFGHQASPGWSPAINRWLDEVLDPALLKDLAAAGHVPGPLVFAVDDDDLAKGLLVGSAGPRFSSGYGDARHLPAVLVENHSLKPYRQRVLGTYVLLESALRTVARDAGALRGAIRDDRARRAESIPLDWAVSKQEPRLVDFLAIESRREPSSASGAEKVVFTGKPVTLKVPVLRMDAPAAVATRPAAYWIPPAWSDVVERLRAHGIRLERQTAARELDVTAYRASDEKIGSGGGWDEQALFEGHVRVSATWATEKRHERFAPGSVRVSTDQPLGDLAVLLLEPASPDSFFRWGFFLECLQRIEYVEAYVMEPMAERMLAEDPALKAEFEAKLAADAAFAKSPRERLQWLYRHTPFFDERYRLYPVMREERP